jgi:Domain of unknown function (DUF1707)
MSTPASSPQPIGPAVRRAVWPGSHMRVGDAERSAIADRLAKHFSDGRLNEAEFNDRLDQAMRATTMADLTGLLSDLPDAEDAQPQLPAGGRRHERKMLRVQLERERLWLKLERCQYRQAERQRRAYALRWVPVFVVVGIVAVIVVHTLTHSIGAWLVLGLVAYLWLRRHDGAYRGG